MRGSPRSWPGSMSPLRGGRRKPESLYGSLKMWEHLNRQGIPVARCTVERLMAASRWRGVTRARTVRTTTPDPAHSRAPDLVKRDFKASAPGQLHVADFTYVPLDGGGFGYTAFVIDAFASLITGWECSLSKQTAFVEKAIRQAAALRARQGHPISGQAIHHSDAGSQGGFNRSSQHLDLEVCAWDGQEGGQRLRREGHRCGRRVARRWPGGSIGSGSGLRSRVGCRARTRRWRPACRSRSEPGGSARLAGCPRSPRPRCPGATCRSPSGRRSRSCMPRVAACVRSRGVPLGHRRRSPGAASNAATRCGSLEYRATTAQWHADRRARRPKIAKLAANEALRPYVQERLSGTITRPDGEAVPGPGVRWIGRRHGRRAGPALGRVVEPRADREPAPVDFPDDESMRISHEAIYQALYVQGRGRCGVS